MDLFSVVTAPSRPRLAIAEIATVFPVLQRICWVEMK